MKIKNLSELEGKIDSELAWRKKELSLISMDVQVSNGKKSSEKARALRAGITLLYAHWEGSIKSISEYYLIYVSGLNLKYDELKNNFLAISIKNSLCKFEDTNKATIHNKLIDDIYSKKSEVSNIPCKGIIKTDSNLKMDIFKEIMSSIGIDSSQYELKKQIIDQKLLGNRNKVAHGERTEALDGVSNSTEYIELHNTVVKLIDKFAQNIRDAARDKNYRCT